MPLYVCVCVGGGFLAALRVHLPVCSGGAKVGLLSLSHARYEAGRLGLAAILL